MKLLIVTQKVDRTDPILGFFHAWIIAFASACESVTVIGQFVSQYDLPGNVTVVSLRKEQRRSTSSQVRRFWKLLLKHRKDYDCVLVHMTPIWILLGAPIWILLRKPLYLWYEIKRGSWRLSAALLFVRKVFAATEHGLPSVSKKQVITGHGIDIDRFVPAPGTRESGHLVAVGRITGIKHYEHILRVLCDLPEHTRLTIAGGTVTKEDKKVERELKEMMYRLHIADRVEMGWVAPDDMPLLLQRADLMLHASQGGLDKAVLQAMACGTPVVSTSEAATAVLPSMLQATPETLGEKVKHILDLPPSEREQLSGELRNVVKNDHSLTECVSKLVSAMS